jgi:hypothetical protein
MSKTGMEYGIRTASSKNAAGVMAIIEDLDIFDKEGLVGHSRGPVPLELLILVVNCDVKDWGR